MTRMVWPQRNLENREMTATIVVLVLSQSWLEMDAFAGAFERTWSLGPLR